MTPASPMATDPRLEAAKDEITKLLTERREQDREVRRLSLPSLTSLVQRDRFPNEERAQQSRRSSYLT